MKMIGIVDEFGVESFMPLEGNLKQVLLLNIRSKVNFQRNAIFFCLDFTEKEVIKMNSLIESSKVKSFNEAGIMIVEKINFQCSIRQTEKLLGRFYKLRNRILKNEIK